MPKQTVTTTDFDAPIQPSAIPSEEPVGEVRFILHDDMRITFYVAGEAALTIPGSVTARLGKMLQSMPFDYCCFS